METQIAFDLVQLCRTREYDLRAVRAALCRGYGGGEVIPDDMSYLLLLFLDHEDPWDTTGAHQMREILEDTDATRLAMAMIQRGLDDSRSVARILLNMMAVRDMDPRVAHVLCNILHLVDIHSLTLHLFPGGGGSTHHAKRLCTATNVSKRARLRTCRNVVSDLRDVYVERRAR